MAKHSTVTNGRAPRAAGRPWWQPEVLPRWLAFLAVLTATAWALPHSAGLAILGAVALYALRGPRETVQALTVLAFLIILGKTDISMGRWLVLLAAATRTVWDLVLDRFEAPPILGPLLLFSGITLLFSGLWSTYPLISVLKVTTFTVGVGVTLVSLYRTRHLRAYWVSWFYTLGLFILLASLPLYVLPAGYLKNGVGFQGILTHPQTFGPVLAPITALLTGMWLFHGNRSWIVGLGTALGWFGMYASQSRTSMLATLLGLALVGALGLLWKTDTWGRRVTRALTQPVVIGGMLVVFAFALIQGSAIQDKALGFLFKDDEAGAVTQVFEASRGGRVERSMANFREQPLTGIGFGVPSEAGAFGRRVQTGFMGLPTGASVEKGFMPSAVLEETGLVGAGLVLLLLAFLFAPLVRQADPTLFWVTATTLSINFGEMVFFSVGGMGLYFWMVMALCHVAALTPAGRRARRPTRSRTTAGA